MPARWAPLVDAWLIGIDDHNADDTPAVVRAALGRLPGELVTVAFDGMGPTLSRLMRRGLRRFPNATHGVVADADFEPRSGLDRGRLGGTCSRSTYRILSDGGAESRTSDWIYRNVPGVRAPPAPLSAPSLLPLLPLLPLRSVCLPACLPVCLSLSLSLSLRLRLCLSLCHPPPLPLRVAELGLNLPQRAWVEPLLMATLVLTVAERERERESERERVRESE